MHLWWKILCTIFNYLEGGTIEVNPNLSTNQRTKAERLLDLVKIDKYPGNPKYPSTARHALGFPFRDERWEHRRQAWERASSKLEDYLKDQIAALSIAEFALQRGFFSVWYTVFREHKEVLKELIEQFKGTATNAFDMANSYKPIPRNPANSDPI